MIFSHKNLGRCLIGHLGVSDLAALCLQVLYLGTQVHISDVILATGNLAWNALTIEERLDLFRSARTSCTTST